MKLSSRSPSLELRHSTVDWVAHRRTATPLSLVSMGSLAAFAPY